MTPPFVFEMSVWETTPAKTSFKPVPKSWCKPWDELGLAIGVFALISCPNCHKVLSLAHPEFKVNKYGLVSPGISCHHCKSFNCEIYLDKWNRDKTLYAVAYTVGRKFRIEYCHASTQLEARFHLGPGKYNIIAVGRAVGFRVTDEKKGTLEA